ncbi:MAG: cell wall metabolism sensor histidine kinase WalK [Candidatus Obscuribacterales bacterium]|nr:cell wall metabolism sensor histidine kinase WalK [Candidatus Obscuribacterales bacterium]
MKLNLTLAQKAIVLVCVPLVFEIAFVGILAQLLRQAEFERAQEAHAKDVQSQVNVILGMIIDAGAGLVISEFAKSKRIRERYGSTADRAKEEFANLLRLVSGHPEEEAAVAHISELNTDIRRILKRAKQDSEDDNKLGLVRDFATLQSLMTQFSQATNEVTEKQREIARAKSRASIRARNSIINFLYLGVFFNIALAVGLALYFNRGTSSRMIILMDNTRRLAKGMQLNPQIGGNDEIAHLDKTFNEMAEALAIAARKERAIIENARDLICSLDSNLKFSAVNPAAVQVWGYTPDELIGKGLDLLVPDDEIEKSSETFKRIRESLNSIPIESRITKKDGSEIEMLWSVQWSPQEERYFCVAHDITERKQIERMKREFVAMVSHDLRTPLTSIQGFLSLLEAGAFGDLSQSGMENLSIADSSISRLIKLINDLLDAERLESGKLELNLSEVSSADILREAANAVETFAQQQGLKLLVENSAIKLKADADRLIQVLINLLSNAVKFSPEGGQITVSARVVEDFVEFSVKDEGRGIPAEDLDAVFERFKQVKKTDAKIKRGTGLGLAICKAIVEKHQGSIGVLSEEGKGSRFWFRIPKELS